MLMQSDKKDKLSKKEVDQSERVLGYLACLLKFLWAGLLF